MKAFFKTVALFVMLFLVSEASSQSLTLTNGPADGGSYNSPTSMSLSWTSTDISDGYYDIHYSVDNGEYWALLTSRFHSLSKFFNWSVPSGINSTNVKLRLSWSLDPAVQEVKTFTLNSEVPKTINITSPIASATLDGGTVLSLEWDYANFATNEYIATYYSYDKITWYNVSDNIIQTDPGTGSSSVNWTVYNKPADEVYFRVQGHNQGVIFKDEEGPFSIAAPNPWGYSFVYPAGGETIGVGDQIIIDWTNDNFDAETSPNGINHVRLEYSVNGGETYSAITNEPINTVSASQYTWIVPNNISTDWKLRLRSQDGFIVSESNTFAVGEGDPAIYFNSPTSGAFIAGNTVSIGYSSYNVSEVTIQYSDNNGASWNTITTTGSTGAPVNYQWTGTAEVNSQEVIFRVFDNDNPETVIVTSSTPISIEPRKLTLTSPASSTEWAPGETVAITWTGNFFDGLVNFQYSVDNGNTWTAIETSNLYPYWPGTFDWTVPEVNSTEVKVKITSTYSELIADESDAFSILADEPDPTPEIVITYPEGVDPVDGFVFTNITSNSKSNKNTYQLTGSHLTGVVILGVVPDEGTSAGFDISLDGSSFSAQAVIQAADATNKTITIRAVVPASNGRSYSGVVRHTTEGGETVDVPVSVSEATAPATITITSPQTGSSFEQGENITLSWSTTNLTNEPLTLEYSVEQEVWLPLSESTVISGLATVQVPTAELPVGTYGLRITAKSLPEPVSSEVISVTITENIPDPIEFISPAGGEQKKFGETIAITWSNNSDYLEGDFYIITYSNDGGSFQSITSLSGNHNSIAREGNVMTYEWTIPNLGGASNYSISVKVRNNTRGVEATSETFQVCTDCSSVTVTSPNGGETWEIGSEQTITWTTENIAESDNIEIRISRNGGENYFILADGNFGTFDGSYTWTVEGEASQSVKIQVANTSKGISDASNGVFTIMGPGGEPITELVESFDSGLPQQTSTGAIALPSGTWTASGVGVVGADDHATTYYPAGTALKILNGSSITTPVIAEGAAAVSFFMRGLGEDRNGNPSPVLKIYASANGGDTFSEQPLFDQTVSIQELRFFNLDNLNITSDAVLKFEVSGGQWLWIDQVKLYTNEGPASFVKIEYPNGGETFESPSSNKYIRFTTKNVPAGREVRFELFNGQTWQTLGSESYVIGNLQNGNEFYFVVPEGVNTEIARLRITDLSQQGVSDESDNVFTIAGQDLSTISSVTPNQGSFTTGDEINISWVSEGVTNFNLYYNHNGGAFQLLEGQFTGVSSFPFVIPNAPGEYRFKLENAGNTAVSFTTGIITVNLPPVPVVEFQSPVGTEVIYLNGSLTVDFLYEHLVDTDVVAIELSTNNGATWFQIASGEIGSYTTLQGVPSASYEFTANNPSYVSELAKFRVTKGGVSLGESDAFVIAAPGIAGISLAFPQQGQNTLIFGQETMLSFFNDGLESFDLYKVVPGQGVSMLNDLIDISTTSEVVYPFTPDFIGNNVKLRIVAGGKTYETAVFNVVYPVVATDEAFVPLTSVNFGIVMSPQTSTLSYLLNTTGTGATVTSANAAFTLSLSPQGDFAGSVEVPVVEGISSRPVYVKYTPAGNTGLLSSGVIENSFQIGEEAYSVDIQVQGREATSGPSMVLFAPQNGAELVSNGITTIRWGSTAVDLLTVEYSLDNGESWNLIENDLSSSFTQFDWLVPDVNEETAAMLRLTDQSGDAAEIVAEFAILPAPAITELALVDGRLHITGSGFSSNANHNQVVFPGFPDVHAYPSSTSSTQLIVEVPAKAVTGYIKVNVTGKGTAISPEQLVLTGVTLNPDKGQVGQTIFISGSGIDFSAAQSTGVTFTNGFLGSVVATDVTAVANDLLSVVVPQGVEATGEVEVDVDGVVYPSAQTFKVQSIGFSPKTAGIFETVTITGVNTNFINNNVQVFINGLEAAVNVSSNTQMTVTVPVGATSGKITISSNDGFFESKENLQVELHRITGLSATRGKHGSQLVIQGAFFTNIPLNGVKVNGVTLTSGFPNFQFSANYTENTITINSLPSNISGTGKVSVTQGGVEVESVEDFTVVPAVNSISLQQAAPGAQVVISGSYFSSVDNTVFFNSSKPAAVVSQTANAITVIVPQGVVNGPITVVNNDVAEQGVSVFEFEAVAAPVFSSFSPLKAPAGELVTVTGQNFQNPGPSSVTVNGTGVNFTVVDNNTLTFTVPVFIYGAGKIQVTKGGVTVEGAEQFTVMPKISTWTLADGAVEGATVTISGTGFNPTAANNRVLFHDNKPAVITNGSYNFLTVTVPAGAQTGKLKVTNQGIFETAESASDFKVVPKATIAGFTPASGQVTKTEVTITGENFSSPNVTNVQFSGTSASFSVVSDTEITATVPSIFQNGAIQISRAGETVTSASNFEIAPDITSLSATTLAPGASLFIGGTFLNQVAEVKIGNTAATITANSNYNGVSVTVPAMTPGSYKVTVTKNGLSDESDAELTVVAPHTIAGFTEVGVLGGEVTITGTNFTTPAVTEVKLNGFNATVVSATATSLVVTVPASMFNGGQGKVSITRAGLYVESTGNFYVRHGITTDFDNQNYIVGQQVSINGNNFSNPSVNQVLINGVSAQFSIGSDGFLSVTIPNAVGTGTVEVIKPAPVGTVVSSTEITVVPGAVLSSFTPTIQQIGETITITGENFTNPDVTGVTINNTFVSSFTVVGPTEITATIPNIAAFNTQGNVQVTRGGLTQSLGTFTVKHTATGVAPGTVAAGALVTVNGSFFTAPNATVTLGDEAVAVAGNNGSSLTFTVPSNTAPGTREVVVTRLQAEAVAGELMVLAPHTIVSLDNDRKAKGETVTITGTGFDHDPQVFVNGGLVDATVEDEATISFVVQNITGGTATVVIKRAGLEVSSLAEGGNVQFYVLPSVSSDLAASAYVLGQEVNISGSNFTTPNVSSVEVNGLPVQTQVVNDNLVRITLSSLAETPLAAGTHSVKLIKTTPDPDIEVTLEQMITIDDQSTIEGITEASAPAGAVVTITGTRFTAPDVTSVRINGAFVTSGNFTVVDENTITAKVPTNAVAYADGATNNIELIRGGLAVFGKDEFIVEHKISGFLKSDLSLLNPATERVVEGQTIYVEGSHFESLASISEVRVNGLAVVPEFISGNRLKVVIPGGAQGMGKVEVDRREVTASSAQALIIAPAASIATIDPEARIAGGTITIKGDHFTLPNAEAVTVNGAAATFDIVNDDNIKVTVPAGATATGDISVTRGGVVSNVQPFKVVPRIFSFTNAGVEGSEVTITGSHFGSTTGTNEVYFSGVSNMILVSTMVDASAGSIKVEVPAGAVTGPLKVVNATSGQSVTSSANFNLLPSPGNFSITPAAGPVASQFTINGTALAGVSEVMIGAVKATTFTVNAEGTGINVTIPSSAITGDVTIKKSGQSFPVGTFNVTPKITSFPALAVVGSQITINGKTFTGATGVTINGEPATLGQVTSDFVKVTTTTANVGIGNIVVTTPSGSGTSSTTIEIKGQPAIAGFSPQSGKTGDEVTITGSNLSTVTFVRFNNINASFTISSDSELTALVPSGASTGKISLGLGGTAIVSEADFSILPQITTFTASAVTGATILINGTNFTGATEVAFNGATAAPLSSTASSLEVVVPAAAQSGVLTVTTASGTSQATVNEFVVIPSVANTGGFSPVEGPIGTTVTITGTGFIAPDASANVVNFSGGVSATASVATTTSLTVQVPAGAITGSVTVTINDNITGPPSSGSFVVVPQIAADGLSIIAAYGGEALTITGTGFNPAAADNTVNFGGGATAVPFAATATSLSVNVPATFATGTVTVAHAGKVSAASTQTLTRKAITLTAPNGNEVVNIGDAFNVTWAQTALDNAAPVVVSYSTDGGVNYSEVAAGTVASFNGAYSWTPGGEPTDRARIKVSVDAGKASDASDANFVVRVKPLITITSPNGGENIRFGKPATIRFATSGIASTTTLKVEYNTGGQTYTEIATGTVAALNGQVSWTVPGLFSEAAKIRISTTSGEAVSDLSDAAFTILPKPVLAVSAPAEGAVLYTGQQVEVTWTSQYLLDSDVLELFYSTDDQATFTSKGTGTAKDLNGKLALTLDNTISQAAYFKLTNADNEVTAVSGKFAVTLPPAIAVTSPAGGETLIGNTSHTISWTTTSLDSTSDLVIEFSSDGGTTYEPVGTGTVAALNGTFSWTVPNAATANGFIRVKTSDGSVAGASGAAFSIQVQATSITASGLMVTPGGAAVRVAEVLLYKANPAGGWDIVATDNLVASQNRNRFSFADLEPADYLIFAKPDRTAFPDLRNTWFGNTLLAKDAVTISLNNNRDDLNIEIVEVPPAPAGRAVVRGHLVNSSGSGRVSGLYIGRIFDDGDPLVNVTVNLLDNATGAFVKDAETDANGYFEMRGLVVGRYRLSVELAGVPMDFGSAVIDLANETDDVALTAAVSEDGTIVVTIDEIVAGVNDPLMVQKVAAYPVPARDILTLELTNRKDGHVKFVIYDLAGQAVFESPEMRATAGDNQWRFDLSKLNGGMYMGRFVETSSGKVLPQQVKILISK